MTTPRRSIIISLLLLLFTYGTSNAQCVSTSSTSLVDICSGNLPYTWNNHTYNEPGCYMVRITNPGGCESIANLCLQVHSVSSSENAHACQQDFPFVWHGKTLPAPGVYMDSVLNYQGCDSVIVLNLAASNVWTGAAGNSWEDTANWACHALPGLATDVVINSGTVVLNSNQTIRSLTVAPGASFTVAPGFDLHITSSAGPASASVNLSKYIGYIDKGNGSFKFIEHNYYYDSLNRLQTLIKNAYQFPAEIGEPGDFDASFPDTVSYSYLAGDTLPYKSVNHNSLGYDQVELYYYDSQTRISRIVYPGNQEYFIQYRYNDASHEIFISDTFGPVRHLLYDGSNVTYDDMTTGGAGGVTIEHNNLTDPFCLVPVNRHIPFFENWIDPREIHFNKNAISQTSTNYYRAAYEYQGIINGVPSRAKITQLNNGQSTQILQFFYYRQ